MGHLHGRLRHLGRHVQQLRDRPGRRPDRAGGHVRARVPAPAGDADRRDPAAPREDREGRAPLQAGPGRGREVTDSTTSTNTGTTEVPEGGFQPPEGLQPVLTGLREEFEDAIREVGGHRGEVVVELERDRLGEVCTPPPDAPAARFRMLAGITGIDYLNYDDRPDRLCADYNLYSFDHNIRIRLKVRVTVEDPHIPSVTGVWPG